MRSARRKKKSRMQNGKGQVFYGLHMYPGVAEYRPPNADPYRIFISERVIREMGPTFQGAPLYSLHRDDVPNELDKTKNQADGWVVRSFFNESDGKHWTEFVVTSERGLRNIRQGYGLSNAYFIEAEGKGGVWNGVDYDRELLKGDYEHLALVPDPRYDSMILTPDEFKTYNEQQRSELKKVANSKSHKDKKKMGKQAFSFFTRKPVTNSKELAATSVMLPLLGKEMSIAKCIEAADKALSGKGKPRLVNGKDLIKIENEEMTVDDIVDEIVELRARIEALESGEDAGDDDDMEDDIDEEEIENEDDDSDDEEEDSIENEDDDDIEDDDADDVDNEEDSSSKKKTKNKKPKTSNSRRAANRKPRTTNSREDDRDQRRGNTRKPKHRNDRSDGDDRRTKEGKERSRRIRHANNNDVADFDDGNSIDTSSAQVARGLQRYG